MTLLLRLSPKCVVMRSIDPEAARGQGERSGVVNTHIKHDSNTPSMR